jgi:hypothetical protein
VRSDAFSRRSDHQNCLQEAFGHAKAGPNCARPFRTGIVCPRTDENQDKSALTDQETVISPFDARLNGPRDAVPVQPPVSTRPQVLPFGELTWENFERLCFRLASRVERVDYVARYGRSGQAQQGIDLFARLSSGRYEVWQAKRYSSISAADVNKIVNTFRAGTWKEKSDKLILAVQSTLTDTKVQEEIEAQATELRADGITFVPYGGEELSELLRSYPVVIDDFFGRGWVEAFAGPEVAKSLGARLDGAEFARVREQLRRFYNTHFRLLDVGVALSWTPDLGPLAKV